MKIKKNDELFTIAVYMVLSSLLIIAGALALFHLKWVVQFIGNLCGRLYVLLEPLLFGIIFAYLLDPIVTFYQKRCGSIHFGKKHRDAKANKERQPMQTLATLLSFLSVAALIGLFILLLVMNVKSLMVNYTFDGLMNSIKDYMNYFEKMLGDVTQFTNKIPVLQGKEQFIEQLYSYVNRFIIGITNSIMGSISDIGFTVMNILLALVVAFYLLQDKANILSFWKQCLKSILSKKVHHHVIVLGKDIDYVFSGYIRGQIIDAIIILILSTVALTLLQIEFAVIIGIVAGIFNLIPYFGPVVGFVLVGLVGLIDPNPMKAVYGIVALVIIQQIDSWVILPKVVGDCVRLHPVLVLLAIVIGGNLFGLWGMLIGVPVAAFIRLVLLRYMTDIFPNGEKQLREEEAMHDKN